jgi:hypothetical protein
MKKKKIPTQTAIAGRIMHWAFEAGFTYHPQPDGTVSLFDIRAKYYVFRGTVQRAIMFISDELHIKANLNFESSPPQ